MVTLDPPGGCCHLLCMNTADTFQQEPGERPIAVIAMRAGILGCIVGTADYDGSRMAQSPEMVFYDGRDRKGLQDIREKLKALPRDVVTTVDMYDDILTCEHEITFGEGITAPHGAGIVKYVLRSEHGFGRSPLTVFDMGVEAIRTGNMTTGIVPRRGGRAAGQAGAEGAGAALVSALAMPDADPFIVPDEPEEQAGATTFPTLPATPKILSAEGRGGWSVNIKVPVEGHIRKLASPDHMGVDEKGQPCRGFTWVGGHDRGKDKQARTGGTARPKKPKKWAQVPESALLTPPGQRA